MFVELEALLLRRARATSPSGSALEELRHAHVAIKSLDGFNRDAIVRLSNALQRRVDELKADAS